MKVQPYKCRLVKDGPEIDLGATREACNPQACERLFRKLFDGLPHEEMWILLLNARNHPVGTARVSLGGMHGCAIKAADVFRPVIAAAASCFVLAHNHPSGDLTPSEADKETTSKLLDAAEIMGVNFHDHLIFTPNGDWISMMETTQVWSTWERQRRR